MSSPNESAAPSAEERGAENALRDAGDDTAARGTAQGRNAAALRDVNAIPPGCFGVVCTNHAGRDQLRANYGDPASATRAAARLAALGIPARIVEGPQ